MSASTLAGLFKSLRARAGFSQEELAERAGLSHRTIGDIESGIRRRRRPVTLHLLADALNASPSERAALLKTAHDEALDAPPDAPASLPHAPHTFGRDRDAERVRRALAGESDFVTVTGAPGVGKTTLALRVASELAGDFAGGATFVALDTVRESAGVLPAIARALGVEERDREGGLRELVAQRLRSAPVLLVLDNVEHLLDAGGDVIAILRAAPRSAILATGRTAFDRSEEREIRVDPLDRDDAVALFVERARAVVENYAPDAAELRAIARVCATLEGLPLAIELAAQRVRSFSAAQFGERIWELLQAGRRDAPARHRALDAAIAWSYEMLDAGERQALRRFAVFAGGATAAAATEIGGAGGAAIDALVRQNLLAAEGSGSKRRLRMLEPIRAFARARLDESGDLEETRDRHAAYFCGLAESLGGRSRETLPLALETFDAERQNFYEAFCRLRATARWTAALRMASALRDLWRVRSAYGEAAECFEALAASAPGEADAAQRWEAFDGASAFNAWLGKFERARAYRSSAAALARQLADPAFTARDLAGASAIEYLAGRVGQALAFARQGLEACEALEDPALSARLHHHYAVAVLESGDPVKGAMHLRLSLRYSRLAGNDATAVVALLALVECRRRLGDLDGAEAYAAQALELALALGQPSMTAKAHAHHLELALARGDLETARADLAAAFEFLATVHEPETLLLALQAATLCFTGAGRYREAAMLFGLWRLRLRGGHDDFPEAREQSAASETRLRETLGAAAFEDYSVRGRALAIADVLELLREAAALTR